MTTLETIRADLQGLTERVSAVEHRQLRFMRQWIASHLTSPISTPTTAPSISTGATAPASAEPPLVRHTRAYLPRMMGWLAEKLLSWLLPSLIGLGLWAWALLSKYGLALYEWGLGWWLWLVA